MGNIEKFDQMAGQYDTPERAEVAAIIADTIRKRVNSGEGKRAIDYGCGTGLVGLRLLDLFDSLVFIDAAPQMIEQIKAKTARLPHVEAFCLNFEARPPELTADYIILAQVLLHVRETEPFLRALFAALNPGGRLLIVDFDKNENVASEFVHNGFDQPTLAALLRRVGFSDVQSETFYRGERLLMNQAASLFIMEAH